MSLWAPGSFPRPILSAPIDGPRLRSPRSAPGSSGSRVAGEGYGLNVGLGAVLLLWRRGRQSRCARCCSDGVRERMRPKLAYRRRSSPSLGEDLYCPICCMTCTSAIDLQQHLKGKRHQKQVNKLKGGNPGRQQTKPARQQTNQSGPISKKRWNKLVREGNFKELFRHTKQNFTTDRLASLLLVVAKKGGVQEFTKALRCVAETEEQLDVNSFHKLLETLTTRVPVPVPMVRLVLNFVATRSEDLVPLLPETLGFQRALDEQEELDEMQRFFRGCRRPDLPQEESYQFTQEALQAFKEIKVEKLMGKVEVPETSFSNYYAHFMTLLHLDFLEELVQIELRTLSTFGMPSPGRMAPEVRIEASEDGKSIICRKDGEVSLAVDTGAGAAVLLCQSGVDPLKGGAIGYAKVGVAEQEDGFFMILNVDKKDRVQKMTKFETVDIYNSVNLIAYQRQAEALRQLAKSNKRFPLWDLLPLAGVGGNILDTWASRMRKALDESNGKEVEIPDALPKETLDSQEILGLKALARQPPRLTWQGNQVLRDFKEFLQFGASRLDPEICEGLGRLNESQREAVSAAVQRTLTVIQGPPGTGKTHVSVEILRMWARMGVGPVLVTSHNNIAVDNIAEKAYAQGLKVVRMAKGNRISKALDACSLDTLLEEGYGFLERNARFEATGQILDEADVVCVTTTSSATPLLHRRKFGAILMDEAAQTTELSALVPICNVNAQRLVLVGDHCQLPAAALALEAEVRGLTLSLFQRLVLRGLPSFFLDTQFRMHPAIAEHSAEQFYEGRLLSGVTAQMRPAPEGIRWPSGAGIAVLDTQRMQDNREERDRASWCNKREAAMIARMLKSVLRTGLKPSEVGVVTPYMGQVRTLRRAIRQEVWLEEPRDLLVASVDSFQGREKELILFSAVRSNPRGSVGFLADWRRLNVMITRARRGLVIVGNARTLKRDPTWANYIEWAQSKGYLQDAREEIFEPDGAFAY
ncbi:unnamed protein product [Effrenium voratum]|uniref:RNA helicase n=1 Tax=Effrenium voratum TaxID=2562239 RepID=A0AA36MUR8_9DINO|nr:unnamed protein product [Effrenium voratum]